MNINFKVIDLTRLGIKPKSRAPKTDALTTRPSELFNCHLSSTKLFFAVLYCLAYTADDDS